MSKEVGKSPEMLQKEAKIRELQAILKKRKSVLKSLKTRLSNNKKDIEEVQFKSSTHIIGIYERLDEVRKEIAALATKLKKLKSLTKEERRQLKRMADEFTEEDMFGEDFREYQQRKADHLEGNFDFAEEERAKMRDIFKEFQVKPDEKEQKDIRRVFVKLSNKFHPDRARTEKEAAEFHEMQQRLNDAYQSGDIHTLLEMERLYLMEEIDLSEAKSYTIDVLQQAIEKLEKESEFIENQITRFQQEIKSLRSSNLGSMLTDLKRAKKQGFGLEDQIEEMEKSLEMLSQLRDAMKESLEKEDISPMMQIMVDPMIASFGDDMPFDPDMSQEEALEMLEQLLKGGKGDIFEKMEKMTQQAKAAAKFDYDQTVKIKSALGHIIDPRINLKNAVGRVVDINLGPNGQLLYEISLDSHTIKKFPKKFIENCIEDDNDFQDVPVLEKDLMACPPRDTEAESVAAYRTLRHTYYWEDLGKKQSKMLQDILLAFPKKNDEENWEYYLRKELTYPFKVITSGTLNNRRGIKMTVTGLDSIDEQDGFIMKVTSGKQKLLYPLLDMEAADAKSNLHDLLEIYSEWQEEYYDLEMDFFF